MVRVMCELVMMCELVRLLLLWQIQTIFPSSSSSLLPPSLPLPTPMSRIQLIRYLHDTGDCSELSAVLTISSAWSTHATQKSIENSRVNIRYSRYLCGKVKTTLKRLGWVGLQRLGWVGLQRLGWVGLQRLGCEAPLYPRA